MSKENTVTESFLGLPPDTAALLSHFTDRKTRPKAVSLSSVYSQYQEQRIEKHISEEGTGLRNLVSSTGSCGVALRSLLECSCVHYPLCFLQPVWSSKYLSPEKTFTVVRILPKCKFLLIFK